MTRRLDRTYVRMLRKAGVKVTLIPGWRFRGRPASTGDFDPVGHLWHHTGSASNDLNYARWLFLTGRSDLPAPLCQQTLDRSGRLYIGAAGRANHAGYARASGSVAAGDGNSLYMGTECMNTGTEGWKPAQYDAMVRVGAVTRRWLGTSSAAQRAHAETSITGKWDPGHLDMDKFRADIDARYEDLYGPTEGPATPAPATRDQSRVDKARALLDTAVKEADPESIRAARLRAALAVLPERRAS